MFVSEWCAIWWMRDGSFVCNFSVVCVCGLSVVDACGGSVGSG